MSHKIGVKYINSLMHARISFLVSLASILSTEVVSDNEILNNILQIK